MSIALVALVSAAGGCYRPHSGQLIHLGQRYEGVLRATDQVRAEPPRGPESRWVFDGQAGQRITIAAESCEFDVYLLLIDPRGREVAWSDDNGWFFNARIRATLPATGRYAVIVSGANADQ